MNKIKQIKDLILKNKDGLTISFELKNPEYNKGYYVSITDNQTHKNKLENSIKDILNLKNFFNLDNLFLGFWSDDNIFYLDLSLYYANKSTALNIAKNFKQKAIYDIKNNKSIYLN